MTCLAVVLWTPPPSFPLPPIPLPPPPGYEEKLPEVSPPSPPPAYEEVQAKVWHPSILEILPRVILQKVLNFCDGRSVARLMRASPAMHYKICHEITRFSFNFKPERREFSLSQLIRIPFVTDFPLDLEDFKQIVRLFLMGRVAIKKHKYHLGELIPGKESQTASEIDQFVDRRDGQMIQELSPAMWKISSSTQHMNISYYGNRILLHVADHRRYSFTRRRRRTNAYTR